MSIRRRLLLQATGALLLSTIVPTPSRPFAAESPNPPNIIFILADDLGWSELGCYGNTFNDTPHLDKLARQGIQLTNAYAAAPVCSPYRAALLTGQYPARVGIIDYLRPDCATPLSTDHVTIAEMLKQAGYATAIIGKWHLTGYRYHGAPTELRPTDHGFDEELVNELKGVGNGANFFPYVFRTQPISWLNVDRQRLPGKEYLVDRMNLEAVDFIQRYQERPFFLFLSHFATHTILHGKRELVDKYREKHPPGESSRDRCYLCLDAGLEGDADNHWAQDHNPHLAAMLESIDDGVGMIAEKLAELDLADNTLIIFTSDNGGETNVTSNAPLRAGKSSLYEGGIRVPFIATGPDVEPNSVSHVPVIGFDLLPTLYDLAGGQEALPKDIDGGSFRVLLENGGVGVVDRPLDALVFHRPLHRRDPQSAIRVGDWKLVVLWKIRNRERQCLLFNLADDVGEQNDQSKKMPEKAEQLERVLMGYLREVDAERPEGNLLEFCDYR